MSNEHKIDNRKDFLLLLLYSKGRTDSFNESIIGRTRIVKMMFLFMKEVLKHFKKDTQVDEDNFYQFFPWHFGPFSQDVYDDIAFFNFRGFLEIENSQDKKILESYNEWKMWLDEASLDETTNIESPHIALYQPVQEASLDETANIESTSLFQINYSYEESFTLTSKGEKYAKGLYDNLTSNQKELLANFKLRLVSAPLRGILNYVYKSYPQMTTKSKIKHNFKSEYHPVH